MDFLTSTNTSHIDVLTCKKTLTVLRCLSDGLWADPKEIAAATPLSLAVVKDSLQRLALHGFVEEDNGQYRELKDNVLPVVQSLAAA